MGLAITSHYAALPFFPRVRFGISGPVPGIDGARGLTAADDPIRFGVADQLTLTPVGTATGGTAYLTSRAGVQFAVRISGVTGAARAKRTATVRCPRAASSRARATTDARYRAAPAASAVSAAASKAGTAAVSSAQTTPTTTTNSTRV